MSSSKIEVSEKSPSIVEKAMKHKWMVVGGIFCAVIMVMVFVTKPSEKTRYDKKKPREAVTSLLPGDARESDWIADAQVDLRNTQSMLDKVSKENRDLKESIRTEAEEAKKQREQNEKTLGELQNFRVLLERSGQLPAAGANVDRKDGGSADTLPAGLVPPPRPGSLTDDVIPLQTLPGSGRTNGSMPSGGSAPASGAQQMQRSAPIRIQGADPKTVSTTKKYDALGREVNEVVKKNPYRGYLPAGSFADVALLSGAEVGTAEFTRSNPQPFLMRVQTNAITAGNGRYKLTSCYVMGEGFGELSSERVFVRATKLICTDQEHKLILEEGIKGYMVDSDGTQGLRGLVIRRNGQLIAKALLAGFAEGITEVARAASQANSQQITGALNGSALSTTSTSIDPNKLAQAGAFGGAANAASQLADMYITEAKSMFPVISVPAGRKGTLVIQEGKSLEWKTYEGLFVVEKTPVKSSGSKG